MSKSTGILVAWVFCIGLTGCARLGGGAETAAGQSIEPSDYQKVIDCSNRTDAVLKQEKENEERGSLVQAFSHWNRRLQKCFVRIEVNRKNATELGFVILTTVRDAYEGRVYLDWISTVGGSPGGRTDYCSHRPWGAPSKTFTTGVACEDVVLEYFEEREQPDARPK